MADLCGPTNALQSFKNHTSQDRTLQQDRLVSHTSSQNESFRNPSPNSGALDAEFEAFQKGVPLPAMPAPEFFQNGPPHAMMQHAFENSARHVATPPVSAAPDWATDFQRMNLGTPESMNQAHTIQSPSSQLSSPQPMETMMPTATSYSPMSFGFMNGGYTANMGMGYMNQQQQGMVMQQPQPQQQDNFDMAAFERAFDEASAQMAKTEAKSKGKERAQVDPMMSGAVDSSLQEPYESIVFEQNGLSQEQQPLDNNNPDALSQTAGQLLNSVSHDTSEKFAQSNFLALMRKLRDREVVVEGENFIDSSSSAIANTTGVASETIEEPESLPNLGLSQPIPESKEPVVFVPSARPVTPEIDPPAPTFDQWKQRLMDS